MFSSEKLGPADAAILETFVVPRYLHLFGELALEMLSSGPEARLLHVGCRTGYPDQKFYERIDDAEILGIDSSLAVLELARHKVAVRGTTGIDYRILDALPGGLDAGSFTHAVCLHPIVSDAQRAELFATLRWLLCSGGQALTALPLRGSFQEVADLLREYALKHEEAEFGKRLEASLSARPSLETLSEQLEDAGFEDVDIEVRHTSIVFDGGRAFFEDPVSRLLILPEVRSWLPGEDLQHPLEYVREALDKYFSEGRLDLSLNVGCASSRCP